MIDSVWSKGQIIAVMISNLAGIVVGAILGFVVGGFGTFACGAVLPSCQEALGTDLMPVVVASLVGLGTAGLMGPITGAVASRLALGHLGARGARQAGWLILGLDVAAAVAFIRLATAPTDPSDIVNTLLFVGLFGLAVPWLAAACAWRWDPEPVPWPGSAAGE
jgi:hypothetical protein